MLLRPSSVTKIGSEVPILATASPRGSLCTCGAKGSDKRKFEAQQAQKDRAKSPAFVEHIAILMELFLQFSCLADTKMHIPDRFPIFLRIERHSVLFPHLFHPPGRWATIS